MTSKTHVLLPLLLLFAVTGRALEYTWQKRTLPEGPVVVRVQIDGPGTVALSPADTTDGCLVTVPAAGELIIIRGRQAGKITPVSAFLEGRPLAVSGKAAGNRVGIKGASLAKLIVQRDEPPFFGDDFMRRGDGDGIGGEWRVTSGRVSIAKSVHADRAASPFQAVANAMKQPAAAEVGRWYWNNYVAACSFEYAGGRVALDVYRFKNACLSFQVTPRRISLHATDQTGKQTLAAKKDLEISKGWHQLALAVKGDQAVAFIDLTAVLSCKAALPCGRIGIQVADALTRLDDAVVLPLDGRKPIEALRAWWGRGPSVRNRRLDAVEAELGSVSFGGLVWDPKAECLSTMIPVALPLELSFAPRNWQGDLVVRAGRKAIPFRFGGVTTTVAEHRLPAGRKVKVRLNGREAAVSVDGKRVKSLIAATDSERMLLTIRGPIAKQHAYAFSLEGPNARLLTFYRAPALLSPRSGIWDWRALWACSPQPSWFGGEAGEVRDRVAWADLKEPLTGDFHLRLACAIPMRGDQTPYYDFPVNVGVILQQPTEEDVVCLFGLRDAETLIAKGRTVLAKTDQSRDPAVRIKYSWLKKDLHLKWFNLSLVRRGNTLSMAEGERTRVSANIAALGSDLSMALVSADNGVVISRLSLSGKLLRPSGDLLAAKPPGKGSANNYLNHAYRLCPRIHETRTRLTARSERRPRDSRGPRVLACDEGVREAFRKRAGINYYLWRFGNKAGGFGFCGYDGVDVFIKPDAQDTPKKGSALVVNRHVGGGMLLPLSRTPFDIDMYPELMIDVELSKRSRPGVVMIVNRKLVEMELVSGYRRDGLEFRPGRRQRLPVNLIRAVEFSRKRIVRPYVCEFLALNDPGWQEHTRGDWYELHEAALVPHLSAKQAGALNIAGTGVKEVDIAGTRLRVRVPTHRRVGALPRQPDEKPDLAIRESDLHLQFSPGTSLASFEHGDDWGEVSNRGGMVLFPRMDNGIRFAHALQGQFNTWEKYVFLKRKAFDVDEKPLLRFRYRLRSREQGWIGARVGREVLGIFDSHNHGGRELRKSAPLKNDDRWHNVVLDLRKVLKPYLFRDIKGKRIVEQVFTVTPGGGRWRRGGPSFRLDEVIVYSAKPESLEVTAGHLLGDTFGGLAWKIDNDPKGQAADTPQTKAGTFIVKSPADSGKYLHVRAFDNEGKAGPTRTVQLFP